MAIFGFKQPDAYSQAEQEQALRNQAWQDLRRDGDAGNVLLNFGLNMLANSETQGFGQALGGAGLSALNDYRSVMAARQKQAAAEQARQDELKQQAFQNSMRERDAARADERLGMDRERLAMDKQAREDSAYDKMFGEQMESYKQARDLWVRNGMQGSEPQMPIRAMAPRVYGNAPVHVGDPVVTTGTQGGTGAGGSLRFNNPLGLKGGNGGSEGYRVFGSVEEAYPAALAQMKRYAKAGAVTPRDLITGVVDPKTGKRSDYAWSTASAGNPTSEYMRVLSAHGVNVDAPIDLNDPKQAAVLLSAMGWMERGSEYGKQWTPERVYGALTGEKAGTVPQKREATGAPGTKTEGTYSVMGVDVTPELYARYQALARGGDAAAMDMVKGYEAEKAKAEKPLASNNDQFHVIDRYEKKNAVYQAAGEGYRNVLQYAQDESGASDIALVFAWMKANDPSSVVRESEQEQARAIGDMQERAKAWFAKNTNGQTLTPAQRKMMVDSSRTAFINRRKELSNYESHLEKNVLPRYSLDPKQVFYDAHIDLPGAYDDYAKWYSEKYPVAQSGDGTPGRSRGPAQQQPQSQTTQSGSYVLNGTPAAGSSVSYDDIMKQGSGTPAKVFDSVMEIPMELIGKARVRPDGRYEVR